MPPGGGWIATSHGWRLAAGLPRRYAARNDD